MSQGFVFKYCVAHDRSFRVSISKNKNIDQAKETCAIMSLQVKYETEHISLLCDSTMLSTPNFYFLCILL